MCQHTANSIQPGIVIIFTKWKQNEVLFRLTTHERMHLQHAPGAIFLSACFDCGVYCSKSRNFAQAWCGSSKFVMKTVGVPAAGGSVAP